MDKIMDPHWREISYQDALACAQAPIAAILDRALNGGELGFGEGVALGAVAGEDLVALVKTADELRRRKVGDVITYVVNRNLNFTNICFVGCAFCGFSRGPKAKDAYFHSSETLLGKAREAATLGATELCIQGGLPRNLKGDYYADLLRDIHSQLPELHLHAFSPMEISYGVEKTGLSLAEHLTALKEAGLGSIPGTAAEILDDEVRAVICPDKVKTAEWLEVMAAAHGVGLRSTVTIMYGHVDRYDHWARHLLRVRALQQRTGGFTEFVPLPFVPMEAPISLKGRSRLGPTWREAVLMHAVARLALHPVIPNIQCSWVKLGPEGAAACLEAGCNDMGGTLMNESISRAAGASFGQEMPPENMEALIRSLGRTPRQRTTLYRDPPSERIAASFGAAPLMEPINTPARKYERPEQHAVAGD
jgi:FO synthase